MLADAGWDVVVLEAQPEPGGAVKSAELTPGYVTDLYSAFYPMTAVSPAIAALELEQHGLRWTHAPAVVGHARSAEDDDAPVIWRDIDRTAADLARRHPADGDNWMKVTSWWRGIREPLLETLFSPFPPVRGAAHLLRRVGPAEAVRLVRLLVLPAMVMADELFDGPDAKLLLLGNAMHADVPVDSPGSGIMGLLLTMLAQEVGYPVPVGGAGQLTAALVRRAEAAGARIECNREVTGVQVSGGRATAVTTADGATVRARRAVLADVTAPKLFRDLLPADAVPQRLRAELDHFTWDTPVVKVNYALREKIPWRSRSLSQAGTVHLGADAFGLIRWMADINTNVVPEHPFMLFGQMTTSDPSRSADGTESAWAYTHMPREVHDDASAERLADAVDRVLEAHAPGFSDRVVFRNVQRPSDLEASNANLHDGAVNGGTAQVHQQLIFRPYPGFGRSDTPIEGLFLASASASPGGSVHGVCGRNAASAALSSGSRFSWPRRKLTASVMSLLER
ncbi:NAD(P)/FAD-dependent oxidoreductase [Mycobacterium sp. MYCO198283]|nr:NAD(P)/FAD-dependent oxidoreductase [Mycobacterium sp. MYCO198283]